MKRFISSPIYLLLFVFIFSSCASLRPPRRLIEKGVASWYGPNFHGKTTANGEKYDQNKLTAAHKTLPFNTLVRVLNKENGKSVIVRINDRGPYAKGRIIDLSRKAAKEIGMINSGTAKVDLYLIKGDISEVSARVRAKERFTVQVASYNNKSAAKRRAKQIDDAWVKSVRVKNKTVYRVYVGKYLTKEEANVKVKSLSNKGIEAFVKQL